MGSAWRSRPRSRARGCTRHAELTENDEGLAGTDRTIGKPLMGVNPMALIGSYMIDDDMELAARIEEIDDI